MQPHPLAHVVFVQRARRLPRWEGPRVSRSMVKAGSGRDARTGIDTQRVSPSDMVTHCAGCRLARGAGIRGGVAGGGGMGGDGTVGGVGGSFGGLGGGEHGMHRPHVMRQ